MPRPVQSGSSEAEGKRRRRRWGWWVGALAVLGVSVPLALTLREHRDISRVGSAVYHERDENNLPPIDPAADPVLRDLAPPPGSPQAPAPYRRAAPTPQQIAGVIRVLLIGNDSDTLGQGRGDVLMVARFVAAHRQLTLVNIPRDLRLDVPGHGLTKVNAAYAYGGQSLTARTLERYLGVPFEYYVEVSQRGFRRATDLLGGVDVRVPFGFRLDEYSFAAGPAHLSGTQALAYVRMRKADPEGDLGRNARQQQVLLALLAKLGRLPSDRWPETLRQLQGDLRTDFSPSEVVRLRAAHPYVTDPARQRRLKVQARNVRLGGVWYVQISDAERRRLYLALR